MRPAIEQKAGDRELLEMAAKAAGIKGFFGERLTGCGIAENSLGPYWNPLTDDGDALRLAVKLRIRTEIRNGFAYAEWNAKRGGMGHMLSVSCALTKGDECAAIRLATVSAAAEIGKAMP